MKIACNKCPYMVAVQPGEKRPPWCPRCGSDLKEAALEVQVAAVTAVSADSPLKDHANGIYAEAKTPSLQEKPLPALLQPPPTAGQELTELEPAGEQFGCNLLWPVIGFLCVVVCGGIVAVAVSQLLHPAGRKSTQTGIYGVMGLFGVGALLSAYMVYRFLGQKYAAYPDRLIAWHHFTPTELRWDQIREVTLVVHRAWTKYQVKTRLGGAFTVSGETKDHKRLGDLIAGRVAAQLLPAALQEIEAGRDVRVGPLRVSNAGVTIDGQLEAWHRIGLLTFGLDPNPKRGTSLRSNMIHVRIGTFLVEMGDIPNYRLFEAIARHVFPACVV